MSEYNNPIPREVYDQIDELHDHELHAAEATYLADERVQAVGRSVEPGPNGPTYIINVLWRGSLNEGLPAATDFGVQLRHVGIPLRNE